MMRLASLVMCWTRDIRLNVYAIEPELALTRIRFPWPRMSRNFRGKSQKGKSRMKLESRLQRIRYTEKFSTKQK